MLYSSSLTDESSESSSVICPPDIYIPPYAIFRELRFPAGHSWLLATNDCEQFEAERKYHFAYMDAEKLIVKSTERAAILSNLKKSYGGSGGNGSGSGSGSGGRQMLAPSAPNHSNAVNLQMKLVDKPIKEDRTRPSTSTSTNTNTNTTRDGKGDTGSVQTGAGPDTDAERKLKRADAASVSASGSSRARDSKALDTLLAVIGSTDSRARRYFAEQLDGKSLVLSNTGKRVRAASATSRGKVHLQRARKRASETSLRRSRGLEDSLDASPRLADLQVAHNLWLKFVWAVVDSCGSAGGLGMGSSGAEAQLQSRLHTAGWLGAKVCVRFAPSQKLRRPASAVAISDSDRRRSRGEEAGQGQGQEQGQGQGLGGDLEGYVCRETTQCLYVAACASASTSATAGVDGDGRYYKAPHTSSLENVSAGGRNKTLVSHSGVGDGSESESESDSGSGSGSEEQDSTTLKGIASSLPPPSDLRVKVFRVLRAYSEVIVPLPAKPGSGQMDRVCVLRGKKYEEEDA
jgi:hypothetical protein